MSVQTKWMRAEMLGSPRASERKLTEAELRVQKSLQKLSIPDWYLNKRPEVLKILTNATPIESRPSSWKNGTFKKKSNQSNIVQNSTGTYKVDKNENKAPNKQTKANSTCKDLKSERNEFDKWNYNSSKDGVFNFNISQAKFTGNISKTFPKVSPSRKIQNINIVFPRKKEETCGSPSSQKKRADLKYKTFVKRSCKSPKSREIGSSEEETESSASTLTKRAESRTSLLSDTNITTSRYVTANMENVKEGAKSPNSTLTDRSVSPSGKYSICIKYKWSRNDARIEDETLSESQQSIPYCVTPKKNRSQVDSDTSYSDYSFGTPDSKAVFTMPAASTPKHSPVKMPLSTLNDEPPIKRRSIFPRYFGEKLEVKTDDLVEEKGRRQSVAYTGLRKPTVPPPKPEVIQRRKKLADPAKDLGSQPSPSTRFFHSRKKSTELENIVKTSTNSGGTGIVKGIIQQINRRLETAPSPAPRKRIPNKQTFVKSLVQAMEKGCKETAQQILATKRGSAQEEDLDSTSSCTESAASSITISIKDSDSDFDQISPSPTIQNRKFNFDQPSKAKNSCTCKDDSVYWIPVSRSKLPRTSSLLSIMSSLSGQQPSPCISPIKGGDGYKTYYGDTWGSGKMAGNMARPLFRIDETTVMDSGFSDRSDGSDRSGASSSEFSRISSFNDYSSVRYRKSIFEQ